MGGRAQERGRADEAATPDDPKQTEEPLPMTAAATDPPASIRTHRPGAVHVVAEGPGSMQAGIDRAVEQLRPAAVTEGNGILVTRWSQSMFTVEASAHVPCGVTVEQDRWDRRAAARRASAGDGAHV